MIEIDANGARLADLGGPRRPPRGLDVCLGTSRGRGCACARSRVSVLARDPNDGLVRVWLRDGVSLSRVLRARATVHSHDGVDVVVGGRDARRFGLRRTHERRASPRRPAPSRRSSRQRPPSSPPRFSAPGRPPRSLSTPTHRAIDSGYGSSTARLPASSATTRPRPRANTTPPWRDACDSYRPREPPPRRRRAASASSARSSPRGSPSASNLHQSPPRVVRRQTRRSSHTVLTPVARGSQQSHRRAAGITRGRSVSPARERVLLRHHGP